MMKNGMFGSLFALGAALAVSWGGELAVAEALHVKADGSSTVYPITEAVAEEFGKKNPKVKVTVGISGTGGGFKKFCAGEIDFSNASRPIKESEHKLCSEKGIEYIELPVAYDALTVVINPKNDWATSMTVAELKKMWEPEAQGKVMKWSDVRAEWPDKPLKLFGAGTDSGTFDYFTEAINGKEKASRGDYTASEDDNVLVQGVSSDVNALGFFGYAYYEENKKKLRSVGIDGGAGPVQPSRESVEKNQYKPLSRPLFVYVSKKALERKEVKDFVHFYLAEAKKLVGEVGYIALPDEVYNLAKKRVQAGKTGSIFGAHGSQVGVSLSDLLAKEAE